MTPPAVSVVIPVYNAAVFLRETVTGVVNQTFSDWELLLVDDGSQDGSYDIAREFEERHGARIRVLRHPDGKNHGQFDSRVLGVLNTRGSLIAFLDADDRWDTRYLEKRVSLWKKVAPSGVRMIFGPSLYSYDDPKENYAQGSPRNGPGLYLPPTLLMEFMERRYAITPCPSSMLVDKEAILKIQAFRSAATGCGMFEDQITTTFLVANYPVWFDNEVLTIYRQHSASACATAVGDRKLSDYEFTYLKWLIAYTPQFSDAVFVKIRERAFRDLYHCISRHVAYGPRRDPLSKRVSLMKQLKDQKKITPDFTSNLPKLSFICDMLLPVGTSYKMRRVFERSRQWLENRVGEKVSHAQ